MKDSVKLRKLSTQLNPKLIDYMAPDGWLDFQKTRNVFYAAGIINPNDDADLFDAIVKNTEFLNEFLSTSSNQISVSAGAADSETPSTPITGGQPMKKLHTKKS